MENTNSLSLSKDEFFIKQIVLIKKSLKEIFRLEESSRQRFFIAEVAKCLQALKQTNQPDEQKDLFQDLNENVSVLIANEELIYSDTVDSFHNFVTSDIETAEKVESIITSKTQTLNELANLELLCQDLANHFYAESLSERN